MCSARTAASGRAARSQRTRSPAASPSRSNACSKWSDASIRRGRAAAAVAPAAVPPYSESMAHAPLPRSSGILLHPTSLPGPFGIGDLGPSAYRWIETLAAMRQRWWQVLPLGPTGAGDSPYQSFSAFAGNINLLSPELLERDGLVASSFWAGQQFADDRVDFDRVGPFKSALLRAAWDAFRGGRAPHLRGDFTAFEEAESPWLNGYATYMAIRESLGGRDLIEWPADLLHREPKALAAVEKPLAAEIAMHRFGQFLFDRQWS